METVRIRDPGWKKVGSGIRDKHPGSATLITGICTRCAVCICLHRNLISGAFEKAIPNNGKNITSLHGNTHQFHSSPWYFRTGTYHHVFVWIKILIIMQHKYTYGLGQKPLTPLSLLSSKKVDYHEETPRRKLTVTSPYIHVSAGK
jgi:hypothetical protein